MRASRPPANDRPNWGTIVEAAEIRHVSTKTIRRKIAAGDIEAERIGTRMIRVNLNTLDRIGRPMNAYRGDAA